MSETKEKPERSNAADVAESLLLALDAGPNKPSLPVLEAMLAEALKANDVILVRAFAQPPAPPAQSKTSDVEAELADARRELAHEAYGAASMLADGGDGRRRLGAVRFGGRGARRGGGVAARVGR